MPRLFSAAAFAVALVIAAPVWAQTAEQLNRAELNRLGQPAMAAAVPAPVPIAYPALPAYPFPPSPFPYYPYYHHSYRYYPAIGYWGWDGGWDGGWHGGWRGRWHHRRWHHRHHHD
jgi:hypothetical protein